MSAADRAPPPDTPESVLQEAGEMLLVLQRFEQYLLAALLEATSDADAKLEAVLLRDKSTLGQLISLFASKVDLPLHFQHAFEQSLERRNLFVHKLFMQPWFDLSSADGCNQVRTFMRELRVHLKVVLHVLIGVNAKLAAEQVSPAVRARVDTILERINQTVRPEFGGLSEEEYVNRVLSRAATSFLAPLKGQAPEGPLRHEPD